MSSAYFFPPLSLSFYSFLCGLYEPNRVPLHPLTTTPPQFLLPRMTDSHRLDLSMCITLSVSCLSCPVSSPAAFRWVMETRELTVLAGSFVGFQLLFSVASPRLSSAITPGYGRLPSTKLIEWNSRCVTWTHCSSAVGRPFLICVLSVDALAGTMWKPKLEIVVVVVVICCGSLQAQDLIKVTYIFHHSSLQKVITFAEWLHGYKDRVPHYQINLNSPT